MPTDRTKLHQRGITSANFKNSYYDNAFRTKTGIELVPKSQVLLKLVDVITVTIIVTASFSECPRVLTSCYSPPSYWPTFFRDADVHKWNADAINSLKMAFHYTPI